RAVAFGQRPVPDAVASGDLRLDGDPDAASRLTDLLLALAPPPTTPSSAPAASRTSAGQAAST
ncbi:MAG: hypothetical protein ACLQK8_29365, partial [Streptosporangiaceae bacterium]